MSEDEPGLLDDVLELPTTTLGVLRRAWFAAAVSFLIGTIPAAVLAGSTVGIVHVLRGAPLPLVLASLVACLAGRGAAIAVLELGPLSREEGRRRGVPLGPGALPRPLRELA